MQIYQDLYICFPSMAIAKGAISGSDSHRLIERLEQKGFHHEACEQAAPSHIIDFDLAMSAPDHATVQILASKFDELAVFDQFTSAGHTN